MPKLSTLRIYVAVLLLQTLLGFVYFSGIGYRTNCRWFPSFYIVRIEDGIHVYSTLEDEDTINACLDDPNSVEIRQFNIYPYSKIGPIRDLFEFYRRESFLSSPDDYRWQFLDMNLSNSEIKFVHQELINWAKNHKHFSHFQPSARARIQFLPAQTLFSLIKVGSYFGFPALITWLMRYTQNHSKVTITTRRRDAGLCIHCAYDCTDLPSPICPECGQSHTIPMISPPFDSHA